MNEATRVHDLHCLIVNVVHSAEVDVVLWTRVHEQSSMMVVRVVLVDIEVNLLIVILDFHNAV